MWLPSLGPYVHSCSGHLPLAPSSSTGTYEVELSCLTSGRRLEGQLSPGRKCWWRPLFICWALPTPGMQAVNLKHFSSNFIYNDLEPTIQRADAGNNKKDKQRRLESEVHFASLFMKMEPAVRKEAPGPPKAKAKAKALKAKKTSLKGIHSHEKEEDPQGTDLLTAQDTVVPKAAQIFLEKHPVEKQAGPLCHHQVPPDYQVSHGEGRRQQQYTCVHCGCQGQQAPDHTGCEQAL